MSEPPGPQLGPYRLGPLLGRGGMGVVYAARDTLLDREVVIKVVTGQTSEAARRRALHEARVAARLRHPGLVPVHALHEQDDQLYIVMERVHGPSVAELLAGGPVPWPEAVRIVAEACNALAAAHAQGVVHRDIKPGNLLLDEDGSVRVVDFGLASLRDVATLSLESGVGTPAYMSPEQCRADAVTPRSDVYALGVTLFHLLTGRLPFEAETAVQVMFAHCSRAVPDPRQHRPELPAPCAAIVRQATARQPHARYADAGEMEAALRAALHEVSPAGPASAAREGPTRPAVARPRLRPALLLPWLLAGAAAVAAIAPSPLVTPADPATPAPPAGQEGLAPGPAGLPAVTAMISLPGTVTALAATPDGRLLAVGGVNGADPWLRLWEVVGGELRAVPAPAPDRPLTALTLARSARLVAVAGPAGAAMTSWVGGAPWIPLQDGPACAVALGADGSSAWVTSTGGEVAAWQADRGWSVLTRGGTCALATAGPAAGLAGLVGGLRWASGEVAPVGVVRAVGPAPGGNFVAVAGDAGVRVLGPRGGARLLSTDPGYAHVAYAPDLSQVAAAGARLTLWRMPGGTRAAEAAIDGEPVGLAWLEGGLALAVEDGLHLWGIDGG